MPTNTIPDDAFWRARIVIGGTQNHILYTQIKGSEQSLDDMLADLKPVIIHAVSVQKQWHVGDIAVPVWNVKPPLGLMP